MFIGYLSGNSITTGKSNVFLRNSSGQLITSGEDNVFVGRQAGQKNTSGKNNVYLGNSAGLSNQTGECNVFIGTGAGIGETGSNKLYIRLDGSTDIHNASNNYFIYGEYHTGTVRSLMKVDADIFPSSNASSNLYGYDLGSSTLRWRNIYARNLYLEEDISLNGDINAKEVYTDNLQVVDYVMSDLIPINDNTDYYLGSSSKRWYYLYANYINTTGSITSGSVYPVSTGSYNLGSSSKRWYYLYTNYINTSGDIEPSANNSYDLGDSDYHWKTVYSERGEYGEYWNNLMGKHAAVVVNNMNSASNKYSIGVSARAEGGTSATYGVRGAAYGTTANYAIYGIASGGTTNYGVYSSGSAGGTTGWNSSSDARLKKDVQQLTGALDKVLKLRGVSYYWKNKEEMAAAKGISVDEFDYGYDSKKHIGVIAQELEAEYPELIHTDGDGFKSVEYSTLGPILIEAMKEQQAIIEGQQKKNEELEAKVEKLEKLVEELLKK